MNFFETFFFVQKSFLTFSELFLRVTKVIKFYYLNNGKKKLKVFTKITYVYKIVVHHLNLHNHYDYHKIYSMEYIFDYYN